MRILSFGSLNIDYVYSVPHIAAPGETVSSSELNVFCGGKGLNQSIALSRAGSAVCHAGMIGEDGGILLDMCRRNDIDTSYIRVSGTRTGTATIQIDGSGQNCILLFGGANRQMTEGFVDEVLSGFSPGDFILLQNEINLLEYIVSRAEERKLFIILNPSPFDGALTQTVLEKISLFIFNEIEGAQITGLTCPEAIIAETKTLFPRADCVLTLGENGVIYRRGSEIFRQSAFPAKVADTTAAGDTFTGYFISCLSRGFSPKKALRTASAASAITVSRMGAADSIPEWNEVLSSEYIYDTISG
jgi:ribokinase